MELMGNNYPISDHSLGSIGIRAVTPPITSPREHHPVFGNVSGVSVQYSPTSSSSSAPSTPPPLFPSDLSSPSPPPPSAHSPRTRVHSTGSPPAASSRGYNDSFLRPVRSSSVSSTTSSNYGKPPPSPNRTIPGSMLPTGGSTNKLVNSPKTHTDGIAADVLLEDVAPTELVLPPTRRNHV